MRPKHCIKNFLIFIPAFFGGVVFEPGILLVLIPGFFAFTLYSSSVYIINDLCDAEKDRSHPVKCKRPIASGAVSPREAVVLCALCFAAAFGLSFLASGFSAVLLLPLLYVCLNLLYSLRLKNIPIVDLVILISGFFIRVLYGSLITGVRISGWLYLVVMSLSFFFALGKRRNEKRICGDDTRKVLKSYTDGFLNQNMYLYLALFIVFYAIWSMNDGGAPEKIWTTPLVMLLTMRYSYTVERNGHGDPISVILSDKAIWLLGGIWFIAVFIIIYFPGVFV